MKNFKFIFCFVIIFLQISCSSDSTEQENPVVPPSEKIKYGYVSLESQAQLNAFATEKYTAIVGGLNIQSSQVNSTAGLETLKKVYGNITIGGTQLTNLDGLINVNIYPKPNPEPNESLIIYILGNSKLENLDGLNGISNSFDALNLSNNVALNNIDGLSNISNITYSVDVEGNNSLVNLNGFSGINNPTGSLTISNNASLLNVSGLSNLPRISNQFGLGFNFRNNKLISSLSGLTSLTKIDSELLIEGNMNLENIDGLSNLTFCKKINLSYNPLLNQIDGLSSLVNGVQSINIYQNSILNNYCGLNGLIENNSTFGFSTSNNLYNPTLVDLQNGNCNL